MSIVNIKFSLAVDSRPCRVKAHSSPASLCCLTHFMMIPTKHFFVEFKALMYLKCCVSNRNFVILLVKGVF